MTAEPAAPSARIMTATVLQPRRVLAWILALLCGAGLNTHLLILDAQTTLRAVTDYNVTWVVNQAALDLARLQTAYAVWMADPNEAHFAEVQRMAGAAAGWPAALGGALQPPIVMSEAQRETLAELGTLIGALPGWLVETEATQQADTPLQAGLARLVPRMARLANAIHEQAASQAAHLGARLRWLQELFLGVMAALFIGSGLLIIRLWRGNRSLRRAQREVEIRDDRLTVQNARFHAALNNMSSGLCMFGADRRMIVCNAAFLDLFGLTSERAAPGTGWVALFQAIAESGTHDAALITLVRRDQESMIADGRAGTFFREGADGRAIEISHRPLPEGGWIATYEDISERRRAEERVTFLAHHDVLTGLPNRELFRQKALEALNAHRLHDAPPVLLFIDLDDFKTVNDTLGHQIGDALLRDVAARLRGPIPADATVARIGGDEFAVLIPSMRDPRDAGALAEKLVEVISEPYALDAHRVRIGASIGIVSADVSADVDELLKCADLALYSAKDGGRRTWRFFESDLEDKLQQRLRLEADLQRAVQDGEFELFYQPVLNLASNRLIGFEALLRWRHPERGLVMPGEFIPVLEETGRISQVGRWVLETACRDAAAWPETFSLMVNLSPVQFQDTDLAETVLETLRRTGLPGKRLEIEITESALLSNYTGVAEAMYIFRTAGIRMALDDFGTGYSSLSYLLRFPFDRIKIDQTFVREMATRADSAAIVEFVARLASQIDMTTTAEGVETMQQFLQVRDAGCTEIQGFFIGKPVPAAEIGRLMTQETPADGLRKIA